MAGPSTFGGGAGENSEAGLNPVLSRNCEAARAYRSGWTSQVA